MRDPGKQPETQPERMEDLRPNDSGFIDEDDAYFEEAAEEEREWDDS